MKILRVVFAIMCLGSVMFAKRNPVPFVNQPLSPATVKPGSGQFELTVSGTGFASGAVVTWNGATRITSFISNKKLQAEILASDVENPGTAMIGVVNPAPGGGASNAVFFSVQTGAPGSGFSQTQSFPSSGASIAGDFNNDGILDLAIAYQDSTGYYINTYLGNGDGTFGSAFQNHSVTPVVSMVSADFNGDGLTDIAAADNLGNTTIFLNHGAGVFVQKEVIRTPGSAMAVGDFNKDGNLDLISTGRYPKILLGNGDGTFQAPQQISQYNAFDFPVVGDFNGDGNLDVALTTRNSVVVFLGNGDGTFNTGQSFATSYGGYSAAVADVNGDGILDIVTNGVSVLLGNGDGTFTNDGGVQVASSKVNEYVPPVIGDFNGDGKLDVAMLGDSTVDLLLGNGHGVFFNPIPFGNESNQISLAAGDFNRDGKLDLFNTNLYLQIPINVSPSRLYFGTHNVGSKSKPRQVVAINVGASTVTLSGVTIAGQNPDDFFQKNNCGSTLPLGQQCQISITFQPQKGGERFATLEFSYQGLGNPRKVALAGLGAVATVTLKPAELNYPEQRAGTRSKPKTATLTNTGTIPVTISQISTSAQFTETNNCPSSLTPSNNCQIQVKFAPTKGGEIHGTLTVKDSADGSPQQVALSGVGTEVELSPAQINFGDQQVGTQSNPAPVQLTNLGSTTVTIQKIFVGGKDSGDFSQTNNCGTSVPPGGSCQINVTFAPVAKGERTANLEVEDNGGGSPQKMQLTGTGT